MSEAIAFDTHRYVKRLTESGFTERQAETLAEEQVALLNANLSTKSDIARIEASVEKSRRETKADIARVEASVETLRQETKADIARVEASVAKVEASVETLRQETKASIAAAKVEQIKWVCGLMIAMTGIFAAIVKLT